ncbi:MAG: hypothetical protein AAF743_06805, partial [Planctomycetota bacterium]
MADTPPAKRGFLRFVNHANVLGNDSADPANPSFAKFGGDWKTAAPRIADAVRALGFNALGYGTVPELWDAMPFVGDVELANVEHARLQRHFAYPDVFDPAFQDTVRAKITKWSETGGKHPNCLGVFWTDTPRWDLDIARRTRLTDWVSAHRNLSADAPGKRAYVDFLRQRHGDFANLPGTYDVAADSWEQLPGDGFERVMLADHRVRADDEAFLGHIAETWYKLIGETFRATAPGVPIFGERYKFRDHPPAVLTAAARWVDAISLQVGPQVGPAAGPGPDDEARFDHDAI